LPFLSFVWYISDADYGFRFCCKHQQTAFLVWKVLKYVISLFLFSVNEWTGAEVELRAHLSTCQTWKLKMMPKFLLIFGKNISWLPCLFGDHLRLKVDIYLWLMSMSGKVKKKKNTILEEFVTIAKFIGITHCKEMTTRGPYYKANYSRNNKPVCLLRPAKSEWHHQRHYLSMLQTLLCP